MSRSRQPIGSGPRFAVRLRARLRVLFGGALAATIVMIGVPVALAVAVGWPVPPHRVTAMTSPRALLSVLALGAWVAWAMCCLQLCRSIAERVRQRDLNVDCAARMTDRLAARLAAAVIVVLSVFSFGAQGAGAAFQGRPVVTSSVSREHLAVDGQHIPSMAGVAWWPDADIAALGVGVLGAGILARRLRRRRQLQSLCRSAKPLAASKASSLEALSCDEPTCDATVLVTRIDAATLVEQVEEAIRQLGSSDGTGAGSASSVQLLCISPSGVDAWTEHRLPDAPPGWIVEDTGRHQHLQPRSVGGRPRSRRPLVPEHPVVLPLGENENGTWLISMARGSCVSVLGPEAERLIVSMSAVVNGWDWSDHLIVTRDAEVAATECHVSYGAGRLLFIGDPRELGESTLQRCTVVTNAATEQADVTLIVDTRAVTVHPFGRTLRPHLASDVLEPVIDRLDPSPDECAEARQARRADVDATHPTESNPTATAEPPTAPHRVEKAMVRLLTPLPRIEGLHEELPSKRARRAIELVAYLALHRPHPVTTDRLRTRVLGSADLDAAAKTLFNTAAAARRSLGTDETGNPLLPAAGRSGHYRVAQGVTVDVLEIEHLVHLAGAESDIAKQIELLRRALALIEGEPMAAVMGGYAWWSAEGHAARTAGLVVDAACHLANVAGSVGLPALAAWGISQARFVETYSEALSRAAMRAAAATGDADRLRREWHDCCRRVDELDPGSMPSEETEFLYTRLVRRTPLNGYESLAAIEPAPRSTVPSAPAAL